MRKAIKAHLLVCLVLLAGCQKEATGQVAAIVNGEEITLQEVNAELQAMNVPADADRKVAQQSALQRIVERRILAQQARKDGLDKTPEFLIRSRQLEDGLLVQQLTAAAQRGSDVPSQKAIDDYMRANPAVFADRTVYILDRIQFPIPSDMSKLKPLNDAHSMDAVATKLTQLGIKFTRAPGRMDSAQVASLVPRIKALPPGEPFVLPENGMITAAVITGETKQPIVGDAARPIAVQIMRNQAVTDVLQKRLKAARSDAKVEYQAGFAPPESAQKTGQKAAGKPS